MAEPTAIRRNVRQQLAGLLQPRVMNWLLIPIMALLIWLPGNVNAYWVRVLTGVFMMAAVAQSFNIIMGLAGYLAFGHTVFFGLGAYAAATLMHHFGISYWIGLVFAAVIPAIYAFLFGLVLLRLRSQYFAVATIGVLYGTRELVINLRKITLGSSGLVVPSVFGSPREVVVGYYMLMLALMVIATLTVWWITRNRFGYGLRAIKSDEDAARVMGIPTMRYKVLAWVIAAAVAGVAGGVFAGSMSYLEPGPVFSITTVVKAFAMLLIGGAGSVFGPVIGAFLFGLASEFLWGAFIDYHMLILLALIVVITLLFPKGISDLFAQFRSRLAGTVEKGGDR